VLNTDLISIILDTGLC